MNHHHEEAQPHDHAALSDNEKFRKLIDHWIKHNEEHAETYREWSDKAKGAGFEDVVDFLNEASLLTMSINELFKKALAKLP